MGYEPTNWKKGDVITAEKLNKLEDGVASGGGGSSDEGPYRICFKRQFRYASGSTTGNGSYYTDYEVVSAELSAQDFKTAVFNGKHPLLVVELRTEHVIDDTGEPTGQPDEVVLYRCTDYVTTSLGTYMMLLDSEVASGSKYVLSIPVNGEPTYTIECLFTSCKLNATRNSDGTYSTIVTGSMNPRVILQRTQRKFIDGEFDFSVVIDNRMGSSGDMFKHFEVQHAERYCTSEDQGGLLVEVYFNSFSIVGRYDSDTWNLVEHSS